MAEMRLVLVAEMRLVLTEIRRVQVAEMKLVLAEIRLVQVAEMRLVLAEIRLVKVTEMRLVQVAEMWLVLVRLVPWAPPALLEGGGWGWGAPYPQICCPLSVDFNQVGGGGGGGVAVCFQLIQPAGWVLSVCFRPIQPAGGRGGVLSAFG